MNENIFIEFIGSTKVHRGPIEPFLATFGLKVSGPMITIGSIPHAPPSIVLKYGGISRRQAKVFFLDDVWYVEDYGSDNGTWLISDGKTILAKAGSPLVIADGSLVLFGGMAARLTFPE